MIGESLFFIYKVLYLLIYHNHHYVGTVMQIFYCYFLDYLHLYCKFAMLNKKAAYEKDIILGIVCYDYCNSNGAKQQNS